jgi:hypothetical protein
MGHEYKVLLIASAIALLLAAGEEPISLARYLPRWLGAAHPNPDDHDEDRRRDVPMKVSRT